MNMKCEACGNENRWTGEEENYPTKGHPNIETKFALCECGHEQEKQE